MAQLFTIGHSTRTLDELASTLKAHGIELLVDIRSFPGSRRLPQFNREALEQSLPQHRIAYLWMKELGGRRKKILETSPNAGLRNESFRNYGDYMLTPPFEAAAAELVKLAGQKRLAIMCAERVWFRCHRMLVSDWLVARGHTVLHIGDEKPPRPHRLTPDAQLEDGKLLYREGRLL